jgi:putative Holliday junction resolvase
VGRILAVDLGARRIGLALSDELELTGQPLRSLPSRGEKADLEAIAQVAREEGVRGIVVGLPLRLDGSRGPEARRAERFIEGLRATLEIPVWPWDERLTTAQAERILIEGGERRKERRRSLHAAAAALILQGFLDRRRKDQEA